MTKKNIRLSILSTVHYLHNYIMINSDIRLTSSFCGSYELLNFIVNKYQIYDNSVSSLAVNYGYKKDPLKRCCPVSWQYNGIPQKVWNTLHKDLTILSLTKNIDYNNLEILRNEYEQL